MKLSPRHWHSGTSQLVFHYQNSHTWAIVGSATCRSDCFLLAKCLRVFLPVFNLPFYDLITYMIASLSLRIKINLIRTNRTVFQSNSSRWPSSLQWPSSLNSSWEWNVVLVFCSFVLDLLAYYYNIYTVCASSRLSLYVCVHVFGALSWESRLRPNQRDLLILPLISAVRFIFFTRNQPVRSEVIHRMVR